MPLSKNTADPADPSPEPPRPEPADVPTEPALVPDQEPTLREHLAAAWHDTTPRVRWGAAAALAVLLAWWVVPGLIAVAEGPAAEDAQARAALERAQWAAIRRQSPVALGTAPVEDALGPGDAERADDRYADYYVHRADSSRFSVLVTSEAFAPDVAVRLPDGRTRAASNLLRTARRAEIDGLEGPGVFEVVVTSREPRAQGPYQLAVVPSGPIDSVYVDDEARLDTLVAGPLRAGRYEHAFGISAGSEAPVVVRVVSGSFRPRVHLFGPNGEVRGEWQTMERAASGDSLSGVVLRYVPGWDAPYRLLVSSEEPRATGPFAIDVRSVPTRVLAADGQAVDGLLGDESWLENGRYVDTYRFRARDGAKTTVAVQSEAFAPAFRIWNVQRRSRNDVTEVLNAAGAAAVTHEATLDAGEYFVEVTSGGPDSLYAAGRGRPGGAYTVAVRTEDPAPPPPSPSPDASLTPDVTASSRIFSTEVRRTGQSGGSTFEVGVTNVAISYPGTSRTRVQLSVTVRSVDYTGNWAPWSSFAGQSYVVDDQGRRYAAAVAESQSPSGPTAQPGTARRGTVVFYLPEVAVGIRRVVLVASIGERTVTLPIPVP